MDDSVIRAEIAALEHVSYFEKSVNIDYTDMAKLLQDRTEISFDLIVELIESMSINQNKTDAAEQKSLPLDKMRSTFTTDNETNLTNSEDLHLHEKMGLDRFALLSRGLSVGKVREYLINMERVHRSIWQPNLNIYANDQDGVQLKNTFQIMGSLNQQLLCIFKNYKHTDLFEPASSDQIEALDHRFERLMKQLDDLKTIIHQVKLLNQLRV